jgi:saccharopine dehydrogenase-like NADP-dependent oxidoreductase
MKHSPQTLLLLGAAGGLGQALLRCFENPEGAFKKIIAVDRNLAPVTVTWDAIPKHWQLQEKEVTPACMPSILELIKKESVTIVVDVTDADTAFIADQIIAQGQASYLCTAFCLEKPGSPLEQQMRWMKTLPKNPAKPHILFSGMNPGVMNMLAAEGIRRHGLPESLVEFEYDSSSWIHHPSRHIITWSLSQFLAEMVEEPAEYMVGKETVAYAQLNAFFHCADMRNLLSPFLSLKTSPHGCVTAHEECVTLAERYNIPVTFIYSVHPETMNYLWKAVIAQEKVTDIVIGNNVTKRLSGADSIGMALAYEDRRVSYFTTLKNTAVHGISATSYQVIIGILGGLSSLLTDNLPAKIYCTEDLPVDTYLPFVTTHLSVQEGIFPRLADGNFSTKGEITPVRPSTPASTLFNPKIFLSPPTERDNLPDKT